MEHLWMTATLALVLFSIVAGMDGVYFHLLKYKLYARKESRYEHILHTIRAFLFMPIVFLLFFQNFGGILLGFALFLIGIDLFVEMFDVFSEQDSRASIGGLSSLEYACHIMATTLRITAIVLILAAKPFASWSFSAPYLLDLKYPGWIQLTALNMIGGNLIIFGWHLWVLRSNYQEKNLILKG